MILMFDIIVPIYQIEPKILRYCLESIQHQTFFDYEVWIIDATPYDWEDYEEVLEVVSDFPEFNFMRQGDTGVSNARNQGMSLGIYPYIALLDGDDFWYPTHLEKIYESILNSPSDVVMWWDDNVFPVMMEINGVDTKCYIGNYNFEDIIYYDSLWEILENYIIFPSNSVYLRERVMEIEGFDESIILPLEDVDFHLRMASENYTGKYIKNFGCIALPSMNEHKDVHQFNDDEESISKYVDFYKEKHPNFNYKNGENKHHLIFESDVDYPNPSVYELCFNEYDPHLIL